MADIQYKISLDIFPPHIQKIISPDAPIEQRERVAKALFPMGPLELMECLIYLTQDKSDVVKKTAEKTLKEIPISMIETAVKLEKNPSILSFCANLFFNSPEIINSILDNSNTNDETFEFVARKSSGGVLERISSNQVRYLRYPRIIEALYYNPQVPMRIIRDVLEVAVRNKLDLSHIPGYEEIVESIFGPEAEIKLEEKKEEVPPPPTPFWGGEIEGDQFQMILLSASWETSMEFEEEEDEKKKKKALWTKISSMTIPEKVRLALLGNEFVRSILIHDSRPLIYMAVLKSPRISEKEIISYARDKSLPDEVVRTIATNREWTKNYNIRLGLALNPKTPPSLAFMFLKSLTKKDIKLICIDKDVPSYIARQAREVFSQIEKRIKEV